MAEHYFAEELTAVPFATLKRVMSQAVPAPFAFCLAAWFRLRGLLGRPLATRAGDLLLALDYYEAFLDDGSADGG